MQFLSFNNMQPKDQKASFDLYESSFPTHERRSETDNHRALGDPLFHFDGLFENDTWIGFSAYWLMGNCVYVEHFAIDPAMRGQRKGEQALAAICEKASFTVLEIEPPIDYNTQRRLHFYEKCGFHTTDYAITHPSYQQPFYPHKLDVLSYPQPIDARQFEEYETDFLPHTLAYSEHAAQ